MFKGDMSILGVSACESDIYRYVLRNPGVSRIEFDVSLDISCAEAEAAVERLRALGILSATDRGELFAVEPEAAIDRLADLRLQELHQELQGITQSRRLVSELRAEQGRAALPAQGIERLRDVADVRNRIDSLAFFARREILSVEPYTALAAENIAHAHPLDVRALRRGVRIRNVVRKEALQHPPTLAYLKNLAKQGAEIRVADRCAERILVYDGNIALVPAGAADSSRGALVVHESGLIATVLALFEKIWNEAEILADPDRPPTASAPADSDKRVLELMCRVSKDEVGARSLGVSVRTYRRYIADLLAALGAANRAHAALIARERGWI
ncbi:TrmB family transcriptional regulator [Streptomyces sp. NPDC001339]|uniref:TrmB family transcriptional regulator n=1 Tax=Streptomyces sp. NPDC001339 TaxID=3364563 RepID=UPI0036AF1005